MQEKSHRQGVGYFIEAVLPNLPHYFMPRALCPHHLPAGAGVVDGRGADEGEVDSAAVRPPDTAFVALHVTAEVHESEPSPMLKEK